MPCASAPSRKCWFGVYGILEADPRRERRLMLQDAHKGMEAMTKAASAVKDEEWGEAERALMEVQEIIGRLLREVGDKVHEKLVAPAPTKADRE